VYAGTALLVGFQAAVSAAGLTILQLIERATGGWGVTMHFFRVAYLFAGPWYVTWLTSFVGLSLMGVWGIWFGLFYRRWSLFGLLAFSAAQALVVAVAIGLLAALTVVLLAGGFATVRRVTV
jgi:hypothetical protein